MVKDILYITNARLPTYKAHGLQIMKMCESFARTGLKVNLQVPDLKPHIEQDPFIYYRCDRIFRIRKRFILELLPYIPFVRSFISYLQNISFSFFVTLPFLFRKPSKETIVYSRDYITLFFLTLFGIKPVAEIHDYRFSKSKWWIRFLLRRCIAIVVNSKGTADILKTQYVIQNVKICIAINGVDLAPFKIATSKSKERKELGLPQDKTLIAYIGQLEVAGHDKGVTTLLQAYNALPNTVREQTELYIIGGPNEQSEQYKKNYPIAKYTGFVVFEDSMRYYKAIDIIVIPLPRGQHATTTSPIKVFHALAAEKVIIASDLPVLRTVLNEKNAVLVPPNDIIALRDAIARILQDPSHMQALAKQAQFDAQKYTWDKRAKKIITFLHTIHE